MTWALIDDKILTHPKMQRAEAIDGDAAWTLWSKALVYVRLHHLHGVVPGDMLALFVKHKSPGKIAATLVKVGLWEVDGENFRIHDYHHINDTPEQVEIKRQEARERMQRRRGVRANKSEQPANNGEHDGGSHEASEHVLECSPPVRDPEPNRTEPSHTDPNRSVKAEAAAAPVKAKLNDPNAQAILDALLACPSLARLAHRGTAEALVSHVNGGAKKLDWVTASVREYGEQEAILAGSPSGPTPDRELASGLRGFVAKARAPQLAATPAFGQGRATPHPSGGAYEPRSGFSSVPSEEEIWGPGGKPKEART